MNLSLRLTLKQYIDIIEKQSFSLSLSLTIFSTIVNI